MSPHKLIVLIVTAFAALSLHEAGHARADFSAEERAAIWRVQETVTATLDRAGSTALRWRKVVREEEVPDEELGQARADIDDLRKCQRALNWSQYFELVRTNRRGNCGEHATMVYVGLKLLQETNPKMGKKAIFSDIRRASLKPGDHVFVYVVSKDVKEVALIDTWSRVTHYTTPDEFQKNFVDGAGYWDTVVGDPQTANPYVKPDSRVVLQNQAPTLWQQMADASATPATKLRIQYLLTFPVFEYYRDEI
ncbi:MAG TPA: hypothetical protein VM734_27050 [Kofleriaceae bacterium]|nr:hypothetical protein [Kofleriaceae bacterium]